MGLRKFASNWVGKDIKATLKCLHWSTRQAWAHSRGPGAARRALAAALVVAFGRRRYLVFHPGAPYHDNFILGKILGRLRLRPTTNIARLKTGCPLMVFKDATRFDPDLPDGLPEGLRVINLEASDIRKSRVEEVFAAAAGYSTFIDPLAWKGPAVEKSDQNATHDGRIVDCPIPATRPGSIYQRLIGNIDEQGRAVDLRVPVVGGTIPLVYVKRRSVETRFSNTNDITELVRPESVLSEAEIGLLTRFAASFGLDFGEMDVLRDGQDGKIFVVDVNNTPFGPPNGLSKAESAQATRIMADAFRAAFLPGLAA